MRVNLDSVKTFFDPHPGLAGALIPIPATVRMVARKLNGKSMTLRKTVIKLQAVTDGKVSVKNGWIALKLKSGYLMHIFMVIRFK